MGWCHGGGVEAEVRLVLPGFISQSGHGVYVEDGLGFPCS
jgi:hypothetical protein